MEKGFHSLVCYGLKNVARGESITVNPNFIPLSKTGYALVIFFQRTIWFLTQHLWAIVYTQKVQFFSALKGRKQNQKNAMLSPFQGWLKRFAFLCVNDSPLGLCEM